MRSATFGIIDGAAGSLGKDVTLEVFRRLCVARHFDLAVAKSVQSGLISYPVYLSLGQEAVAASLSLVLKGYQVFAQHRCHDIYLTFGGDPVKLRDELLGLPSGSSGGRAGSNCLQCFDNDVLMFGHHGLIGENVPLAVGAALGSGKPTACFFGDGAAEEDYVFAAMGFAATHKLPVLFVCVDNNLSILTTVDVRRSWSVTKVAKALGMEAEDVSDDPWTLLVKAKEMTQALPAFLNVYTCRANWHVGVGTDGPSEWDRFEIVRNQLSDLGLGGEMASIEKEIKGSTEKLWNEKQLRTLSGK